MAFKESCEQCGRKLTSAKDSEIYCGDCVSMYNEGKKECFNKMMEVIKKFVYGDNPPHFSINEDNFEEFLSEIKNGIKRKD